MASHKDQQGSCPLTTVLDLATTTAKTQLGTDAENKQVSAEATLTTTVTENGTTDTTSVDATVSLGVKHSSTSADASKS